MKFLLACLVFLGILAISGYMLMTSPELPTPVQLGDEVCIEGYGITQGMYAPQPFVVCGELTPLHPPEAAPKPPEYPEEDRNLDENRQGT